MTKKPASGVSRESRISGDGLARLERHLQSGIRISPIVLQQWVKRYGDDARQLLEKFGYSGQI
jgi:hypothetical protein